MLRPLSCASASATRGERPRAVIRAAAATAASAAAAAAADSASSTTLFRLQQPSQLGGNLGEALPIGSAKEEASVLTSERLSQ